MFDRTTPVRTTGTAGAIRSSDIVEHELVVTTPTAARMTLGIHSFDMLTCRVARIVNWFETASDSTS